MSQLEPKPRILIVDDNPNIHRDFNLVFEAEIGNQALDAEEKRFFGGASAHAAGKCAYELDHAFAGTEAIGKVKQALAMGHSYQMAFVDIRMPGIDGVETIARIWKLDPAMQIVICTAFADYSQDDLMARLGRTDKLLILKKPFDTIEVTQLAGTLTAKWYLARQAEMKLEQMELLVARRTKKVLELQRREVQSTHELDQKKLQFLNTFAQEFRTPLTLLVGKIDHWISDGKLKQQDQETLRSHAGHLLRMVDHLADTHALTAEEAKLALSAADIVVFLRGVIQVFQPVASQHRIELQFQTAEISRQACFDAVKLEKVLFLIFANGLQTTPAGGRIVVSTYFTSTTSSIRIEHSGGPIPETAESNPNLWLVLARKLMEIQGGTIALETSAATRRQLANAAGYHFTITLPLQEMETAASARKKKFGQETAIKGSDGLNEATTGNEELPTLLIIEADQGLRLHIRQSFEAEYQIAETTDGQEGFNAAQESLPDLIIADLAAARNNGVELCAKLKADNLTCHIPVILLANQGDEELQLTALEAGADEFMTKPFRMPLLKARAGNLLESRRRLRERFDYSAKLVPRDSVASQMDLQFLQRVNSTIEKNLSDFEFDVEELAHEVSVSRRQLFRKIRALTGTTPNMLIRSIRLNRAAQLLKESQLNITEVTYAVGFSDLKHFREVFQEQFGVLPSDYANQMGASAGR